MFTLMALKFGRILFFLSSIILVNANLSGRFGTGDGSQELAPRGLANGATLRILCLGASITYGYESTDGNGYRYGLRGALVSAGNKVNMIGSLTHGTMNNNQVEGWDGYRIAEVAQKAELSLPSKPNVVLINAGTNDMLQNFDVANAHIRMGNLIDRIFQVVPNTAIVLSTLLPNADGPTQANVLIFNRNIIGVVAQRSAAGKNIILVDMSSDWFSVADLRPDGTHPTDLGYLKMAKVFYNGIVGLGGRISSPLNVAGVNDLAAKDDAGAGSALDAVCQTVSGQHIPAAQIAQCQLTTPAPSPVASSAAPPEPPSSTPSTPPAPPAPPVPPIPSTQAQTLPPASSVSVSSGTKLPPASSLSVSPGTTSSSSVDSSTKSPTSVSLPPGTTSTSSVGSSTKSPTSVSLPPGQSSSSISESVLDSSSTAPPTVPLSSTTSSTLSVVTSVRSSASATTTSTSSQNQAAKSSATTNSSYGKYINVCLFIALLLAEGGFQLPYIDL